MTEFTETRTVNCPYCGNAKVVKNGQRTQAQVGADAAASLVDSTRRENYGT